MKFFARIPHGLRQFAPFLVLSLFVGVGLAGCVTPGVVAETPMSTTCLEVPTVEECLFTAAAIENICLRNCVQLQCSGVKVSCDANIQQRCKALNEGKVGAVGGYVVRKDQTCEQPREEIAWCQVRMSRQCRARAMVHELAHACGWRHDDGQNVPGNTGELPCL